MKKLISLSSIVFTAVLFITGCGSNGSQINTPMAGKDAKIIYISNSAAFVNASKIDPAIKKECKLNSKLIT